MCMLYVIKIWWNSLQIKPAKNDAPDMSQLSHTLGTARHLDNILAEEWRCDNYWHDSGNININVITIITINVFTVSLSLSLAPSDVPTEGAQAQTSIIKYN